MMLFNSSLSFPGLNFVGFFWKSHYIGWFLLMLFLFFKSLQVTPDPMLWNGLKHFQFGIELVQSDESFIPIHHFLRIMKLFVFPVSSIDSTVTKGNLVFDSSVWRN